jgi:hypothetical protein
MPSVRATMSKAICGGNDVVLATTWTNAAPSPAAA